MEAETLENISENIDDFMFSLEFLTDFMGK